MLDVREEVAERRWECRQRWMKRVEALGQRRLLRQFAQRGRVLGIALAYTLDRLYPVAARFCARARPKKVRLGTNQESGAGRPGSGDER